MKVRVIESPCGNYLYVQKRVFLFWWITVWDHYNRPENIDQVIQYARKLIESKVLFTNQGA